jgi:dimethylargininase
VGESTRTNQEGIRQLGKILVPIGYTVQGVAVPGRLHLKSAVTVAAPDLLVLDPMRIDAAVFDGLEWVASDPDEPSGANVLRVGGTVLCAASAPLTQARLEARGLRVQPIVMSELAKAEGALTCCSLIFRADG